MSSEMDTKLSGSQGKCSKVKRMEVVDHSNVPQYVTCGGREQGTLKLKFLQLQRSQEVLSYTIFSNLEDTIERLRIEISNTCSATAVLPVQVE